MNVAAPAIRARQICKADIPAVADLLSRGFQRRSRRFWLDVLARLADHPAPAGLPQYGYMLESDDAAVGAIPPDILEVGQRRIDSLQCVELVRRAGVPKLCQPVGLEGAQPQDT